MQKFLVFTMPKDVGVMHLRYIEDTDANGQHIEEYLDSMGDIFWAVFPASVPFDRAEQNFQSYVAFRRQLRHS